MDMRQENSSPPEYTDNPIKQNFTLELALLKALAVREHYDNYMGYVVYDRLLPETRVLLDGYDEYYKLYPEHQTIEFNTFLTQFNTNWHAMDMHVEELDRYRTGISQVKDAPMDDAETALLGLLNKQLIDKFNFIAQKPFTSEHIRNEIETYEVRRAGILAEYDKDCYSCLDVDFDQIDKSKGIPYSHQPLQDTLGGKVKGSLIAVVASHGLGKSAFIHTEVSTALIWAKQRKAGPILVFTTEGTCSEFFGRQWSNLYREQFVGGYKEILRNQEKVQKNFMKNFGQNSLLVFTANNKGINYIRMKIKKYKPCLIILDMAVGVMTAAGKNSGETTDMRVFFNTLRELSSDHCPIMATVQAGISAKWWDKENHKYKFKQWLDSTDIYGSKDAIQGAAETIISIGRDDDHELTRYVWTSKLKSEERPVKYVCEIVPKFSHYDFTSMASF